MSAKRIQKSTPRSRRVLAVTLWRLRGKLRACGRILSVFGLTHIVGWIAAVAIIACLQRRVAPILPPDVESFRALIAVLAIWAAISDVYRIVRNPSDVWAQSARVVWQVLMVVLLAVLIGVFADDVGSALTWINGHPGTVLTALVAVWVLRGARNAGQRVAQRAPQAAIAAAVIGREMKTRPKDSRTTAVHEAGHALVCAALPEIPPDLVATVHEKHDRGVLGRVAGMPDPVLPTKAFTEWRMLVCLAGAVAEEVVQHEATAGSASDMNTWQRWATTYLANGFGGFYFNVPTSHLEVEHNAHVLSQMRQAHRQRLHLFLTANKTLLEDLARALQDRKRLEADELRRYLKRAGELSALELSATPSGATSTH